MSTYVIKMPDVGEGIAEAELVEWTVKPGDFVKEDDVIAAVMTDKATVEIPSSVSGTVKWLGGDIGERISIGGELIHLEVDGPGNHTAPEIVDATDEPAPVHQLGAGDASFEAAKPADKRPEPNTGRAPDAAPSPTASGRQTRNAFGRPIASPSVRKAAREAGIDLRRVAGTGPAGRITRADLAAFNADGGVSGIPVSSARKTAVEDIKIVGLRRKIAERMSEANTHIPHITIVEEIDVTALEEMRARLNADHAAKRGKLTVLPFIMRAVLKAVDEQPEINAHFLDGEGIVRRFEAVHIGIATQTPNGLMVPVVRHVETMGLWGVASELARVAEAARQGKATREELSGSTISISSLGPLGALATTPIINRPEVAIVGVNKIATRPVWRQGEFVPRQVMNISCSFDHRIIDGWDAAVFVQSLKTKLEAPAIMFVEA